MRALGSLLVVALLAAAPACARVIVDPTVPDRDVTPPPLDVENFVVFRQGLASSAQPSPEQLAKAEEFGYRTIVSLRTVKEGSAAERVVVQELGMVYVNIPIEGTSVSFEAAEEMMGAVPRRLQPALIHCSSGNRVGALWALYSFEHGGDSVEEALAAGEAAGLKHPRVRKVVERRLRSK